MENNNELSEFEPQVNLIADDVDIDQQYVYASQGQRFLNFLIDNLLMRFVLSMLTGMLIGLILYQVAPEFLQRIAESQAYGRGMSFDIFLLSLIVSYLNYILYYTVCEKLFKGYTLGKIITGTRAIRQDGNELTFKDALMRSLSRCVPFEVFSGFSTLTWHDSWTDTMVIKSR